jgi:YesN/AraC family two-component response regulator
MQPLFQKIEANINHSFFIERLKFSHFPNPLQFHPEVEILLVIQGTGTRLVGDSIGRFKPGDIVLIGKNVPHVWYSDEKYSKENNRYNTEVVFILFNTEIFGDHFWNLPELKKILKLIQLSQRGIKLEGKTRKNVAKLMLKISKAEGFKRLTILLDILEVIAVNKEYRFLASPLVQNSINQSDSDRLNKVYKYMINNYQQKLTAEDAANQANLSLPAFCRYFKKRTNKTFIQFLNEIRIAFACHSLLEEDKSISEICFSSGYNNVSFFIRQFKRVTGLTPLEFRKKYEFQ